MIKEKRMDSKVTRDQLVKDINGRYAHQTNGRRVGEILCVYRAMGIISKTTEGIMSFQYRSFEGLLGVFTVGQTLMDPARFIREYHVTYPSQDTRSHEQREAFQALCKLGFIRAFGKIETDGRLMQSFRFFILTTLGAQVAWTSNQIDWLCVKPEDKSRARTGILKVCKTLTSPNGARLFEVGGGNKPNCRWIGTPRNRPRMDR
jgi:hypothetical protein